MPLLVVGLSHRSAPLDVLERVAVPDDRLPKALQSLVERPHVREAVVLSTCNRVEVYAHATRYHGGVSDLRAFLCEWAGIAPEDLVDHTVDGFDEAAAAHLFAVAAGLDSMIVGERQIHLQVRQAFLDAEAEGAVGRLLGEVFRRAVRVGRRVRTETGLSRGAGSMVDVGIDAAEERLGQLDGRTVLLLGAGKVGGLAARRLAQHAASVLVCNRSSDRAQRLAESVGGRALPLERLVEGLSAADLVVTSTGATEPLVTSSGIARAMRERAGRPMVLLDLAVPRDVDPACRELPGVTVVDVDGVRAAVHHHATGNEIVSARAIVDEETERFRDWMRGVGAEPTVAALRRRAEEVRQAELQRLGGRLADLDDRQRRAVEALTRGILATLLHEPSVRLKELAEGPDGGMHAEVVRDLFDLDG